MAARQPGATAGADLKAGDLAPDFTVNLLDGKPLRLSDLRGKVVLLEFWAGWCAPCVAEMPQLRELHTSFGGSNRFAMVGLSLDEQETDLRRGVKFLKLDWPQAWVGIDSPVVQAYGSTAIPANFLIGRDGRILSRDLRGDALRAAVQTAIAH